MNRVKDILNKEELSRQDIIRLLSIADKNEHELLIKKAYSVKEQTVGRRVHLRGLIEFSNFCRKNCYYCGIRRGNTKVARYSLTDRTILEVVGYAKEKGLMSVVLQSGELCSNDFTKRITNLITEIKKITSPEFRITLSLGEQSAETYQRWFDAGAQRYLLRIETSNEELYKKIHPDDGLHSFKKRLKCLDNIQKIGYMAGTGVMIGLPFQTIENLTDDLLFIRKRDVDMVGMGPYLEHADTPLYDHKYLLMNAAERFDLSIRMIAVLRLMMPDINIASTTALQAITPFGRELGLQAGANVMMPNLTPLKYRGCYLLYDNKPCLDQDTGDCLECMEKRVEMIGEEVAYGDYGDSKHYINRK